MITVSGTTDSGWPKALDVRRFIKNGHHTMAWIDKGCEPGSQEFEDLKNANPTALSEVGVNGGWRPIVDILLSYGWGWHREINGPACYLTYIGSAEDCLIQWDLVLSLGAVPRARVYRIKAHRRQAKAARALYRKQQKSERRVAQQIAKRAARVEYWSASKGAGYLGAESPDR
jgi:hypothetical protein